VGQRFGGLIKAFAVATLAALVLRAFVVEAFRIASPSMSPTLLVGDLVFVEKFVFGIRLPFSTYEVVSFRKPARGEVVAFTLPDRGLDVFVKRIIAVEGDTVEFRRGKLVLNGVEATYAKGTEGFLERLPGTDVELPLSSVTPEAFRFGPVAIPAGHFFVLGDNREHSADSRDWGPVPLRCLRGRVAYIAFSVDPDRGLRPSRWLRTVASQP
jgi:signal peptidase I